MEELEVMGGDRDSLLIFEIPANKSDEEDFGLRARGGLQLFDDVGDEKGLEIVLSPISEEDAIVGDFSCSCVFIWQGVVVTNDDIVLEKLG